MGISYLSKPIAPGVMPMQEPIELIAQVAAQKQAKYDTMLTAVMGQYENLLGLDTSAGSLEITEKYNQLMNQANKDIVSLAKLDLMNPDNADKINNVFSPILENTDIMTAVSDTQRFRKEVALDDQLRLKHFDKYSPKNRQYMFERIEQNRNMTTEEYRVKKHTPVASLFFDIKANLVEQAKNLEETEKVVVTQDGFYIITKEGKMKTQEEIMQFLTLDSRHYQQAEIDAYFNYKGTAPEEILGATLKKYDNGSKLYQTVIKEVNEDLKIIDLTLEKLKNLKDEEVLPEKLNQEFSKKYGTKIPATTTVGDIKKLEEGKKAKLIGEKEQHTLALQELNETKTSFVTKYGIQENPITKQITLTTPLDERVVDGLKTNYYLQDIQFQVAKGMQVNKETVKIETDAYGLETARAKNDLLKLQLEAELDALKPKSDGQGGGGSANPNTPPAPTYIPVPGGTIETSEKETFTEKQMLEDAKATTSNIDNISQQYAEYLATKDNVLVFGRLTPAQQKTYKDKATQNLSILEKGYEAFYVKKEDNVTISGTQSITKQDFDKLYGEAIPFYESMKNNEASRDLIVDMHKAIKSSVPPVLVNANGAYASSYYKNTGSFNSATGSYALTKDSKTVNFLQTDELFSPIQNAEKKKYRILLPPSITEKWKQGKAASIDLKEIYDYNISQNNIPYSEFLAPKSKTPKDEIEYLRMSYEDFSKRLSSQEIENGLIDLPGFPDQSKIISEQFSLLSRTSLPSGFAVVKGTSIAKTIQAYANDAPDLNGQTAPLSEKTSYVLYQKPGESNLTLRATSLLDEEEKTTEVREFPVTPQFRKLLGKEVEEVSSILEIEKGLDYMMRFMQAYNNPKFNLSSVTSAIPEALFTFRGKQYKVAPFSSTEITVVSTSPGSEVHRTTPTAFMEFLVNDGMTKEQRQNQALQHQRNLLFQQAFNQLEQNR